MIANASMERRRVGGIAKSKLTPHSPLVFEHPNSDTAQAAEDVRGQTRRRSLRAAQIRSDRTDVKIGSLGLKYVLGKQQRMVVDDILKSLSIAFLAGTVAVSLGLLSFWSAATFLIGSLTGHAIAYLAITEARRIIQASMVSSDTADRETSGTRRL